MPLKTLHKAIAGRTSVPILGHIHVKDGVAKGTDMDMEYTTPCNKNLKNGMYVRDGFKDDVHLLEKDMPLDDFPHFNEKWLKETILGTMDFSRDDMKVLEWVSKAMSTEETRYYLNGIYFDTKGFVATDGHRLHWAKRVVDWKKPDDVGGVIVPRKAIKLFIDGMNESKENKATMKIRDKYVVFEFGKNKLVTKVIDGTFPNYPRAIPKHVGEEKHPFDPAEIIKHKTLISSVCKASGQKRNQYILKIPKGENKIEFGGMGHESHIPFSIKMPYGVGFNYKFLTEMNAGNMYFLSGSDPHICRGKDKATGTQMWGVLMPVRI